MNPKKDGSRFVKINIYRANYLRFEINVLSYVFYFPPDGGKAMKLSTALAFNIGDVIICRLPGAVDIPIGGCQTRKVRLKTLGYDRNDRACVL